MYVHITKSFVMQAPGTGKALAAVYSAIYLKSPYTCVFAENATHSRLKEEIRSVDKTAWYVTCEVTHRICFAVSKA